MTGPESQRVPEAVIMLASLRTSHRPALSSSELAADKAKARETFERIKKEIGQPTTNGSSRALSNRRPRPGRRCCAERIERGPFRRRCGPLNAQRK